MSERISCFRRTGDGLDLLVRLTPRSSADRIAGIGELPDGRQHLQVRVRAVPEDGKANRALEKLVAKALGVPQSDVSVTAGTTSRLKTVSVAGDPDIFIAKLDAIAGRLLDHFSISRKH